MIFPAKRKPEKKRGKLFVSYPILKASVDYLLTVMHAESKTDVYVSSVQMAAFLAALNVSEAHFLCQRANNKRISTNAIAMIENRNQNGISLFPRPHMEKATLHKKAPKSLHRMEWLNIQQSFTGSRCRELGYSNKSCS
ncbi:MAG: hypothetical protein R3D26_24060 [Cyanobacteriota/Melainabacteria group bacterium]